MVDVKVVHNVDIDIVSMQDMKEGYVYSAIETYGAIKKDTSVMIIVAPESKLFLLTLDYIGDSSHGYLWVTDRKMWKCLGKLKKMKLFLDTSN